MKKSHAEIDDELHPLREVPRWTCGQPDYPGGR